MEPSPNYPAPRPNFGARRAPSHAANMPLSSRPQLQQKQQQQQPQQPQKQSQHQPRQTPHIQLSPDSALALQISQHVRRELKAKRAQSQQPRGRSPDHHPKPQANPNAVSPVAETALLLSPSWALKQKPRASSHSPCRRIEVDSSDDENSCWRFSSTEGLGKAVSHNDLAHARFQHSASFPEQPCLPMDTPRQRRSYSEPSAGVPEVLSPPSARQQKHLQPWTTCPQVILSPSEDEDMSLQLESSLPALDLSSSAPSGLLSQAFSGVLRHSRSTSGQGALISIPRGAERRRGSGTTQFHGILQWMGLSPRGSPKTSPSSSLSVSPAESSYLSQSLSPPEFSYMDNGATLKPAVQCK